MPRIGTADYVGGLARAAYDGAQFTVPQRPAIRPEIAVVDRGDSLAFEGGPQDFAVSGTTGVAALRRLLPLLDGETPVGDLPARCGLSAANVERLVGVLVVKALLQDGPPSAEARDPARILFSRGAARTGAMPDGRAVAAALRAASVAVLGDAAFGAAMREALALGGFLGAVEAGSCEGADLVVAAADAGLVREAVELRGVPVVGVATAGEVVTIGPCLEPGSGICADCYAAALGPCDSPLPEAGALLVAVAVLHLVGRFGRAQVGTRVVRHDVREWRSTDLDVLPRAGCERCVCPGDDDGTVGLIRRYEAAIALPARRWVDPAVHQVHYRASNIKAQTMFRRADGTAVVPPEPLGTLLRKSVGLRVATAAGASPDRYAASPGNLGALIGYCVVRGGVFQYDPERHELVRLPGVMPDRDADGIVMIGADIRKLIGKYGLKAYRLAWLEAGCALGQLHVVAAAAGLADRALAAWDDAWWEAVMGPDVLPCGGVRVEGL